MSNTLQTDPETYWNEEAGPRWIASQGMIDAAMAPVSRSILEVVGLQSGERVVDIGCGCGSLCLEAADIVGNEGRVLGLDISRPMIEHARGATDLGHVSFVAGDAQTHSIDPASFDAAISRFGVMFFLDSVAAFANIARALQPGGRIAFAVWQRVERNPWIVWPMAAIRDLLPEDAIPQAADDDIPGPFRFGDADRAIAALTAAGFADVVGHDHSGTLTVSGTPDEILGMFMRVGPLSRILGALDDDTAATALERVKARVAQLHDGSGVALAGAWWVLTAHR